MAQWFFFSFSVPPLRGASLKSWGFYFKIFKMGLLEMESNDKMGLQILCHNSDTHLVWIKCLKHEKCNAAYLCQGLIKLFIKDHELIMSSRQGSEVAAEVFHLNPVSFVQEHIPSISHDVRGLSAPPFFSTWVGKAFGKWTCGQGLPGTVCSVAYSRERWIWGINLEIMAVIWTEALK